MNRDDYTIDDTPWVVVFECGHSRLPVKPEVADMLGVPPAIGWAGWCRECHDYRKTTKVILSPGTEVSK